MEEIYFNKSNREILLKGAYFAGIVLCSIVLYFVITKIICYVKGCELSSYQNVNHMGQDGVSIYFERIFTAFRYFWNTNMCNLMYPMNINALHFTGVGICIVLILHKVITFLRNKDFVRAAMLFSLMICIPMLVNFIVVMCSIDTVHSIMCYGQVMPFILFAWIIEKETFSSVLWNRRIYIIGSIILLLTSLVYCRFANVYYLKYCFTQNQLVSYYNTMITRIKSCKGYNAKYPITFVGDSFCDAPGDVSGSSMPEFLCDMVPLGGKVYPDMRTKEKVMRFWCGYCPTIIEPTPFERLPEVKAMSIYPNYGSIKVINNTVVIKINHLQSD